MHWVQGGQGQQPTPSPREGGWVGGAPFLPVVELPPRAVLQQLLQRRRVLSGRHRAHGGREKEGVWH